MAGGWYPFRMRTTIRLDDRLLAQAKRVAHDTGRTLTAVIEDALRAALARRRTGPKRGRVRLPTFNGDGLQPGVDLDDSSSLLDTMER
jgi:Arc/MetJ family transcription regulator